MTKREKLRIIIKRDVETGFVYEVKKQLKTDKKYVLQMSRHPEIMADFVEMIVDTQLPYYETVSEEGVEAAYQFFTSDAGKEWCMLSARFVNEINALTPGWLEYILQRLAELN